TKIIALGGGLAAAIAAVVYFGMDYPPSRNEVAGTIAPAQRYRAPPIDEKGVQLGDQGITQLMQTDTFTRLVKDAQFRAFATNAHVQALARNTSFSARARNPGVQG